MSLISLYIMWQRRAKRFFYILENKMKEKESFSPNYIREPPPSLRGGFLINSLLTRFSDLYLEKIVLKILEM